MLFWILIGLVSGVVALFVLLLVARAVRRRNSGPVSIVLMRSSPRRLTETDVRGAVRRATGVEPKLHQIPVDTTTNGYAVMADELPTIFIVDSARTYMDPDEVERSAMGCEDPRARDAIRAHKAWVSVDAKGASGKLTRDERYKAYDMLLGKVAAQLLDDQCLLVYAPAEGRFGPCTQETESMLSGGRVGELLGDDALNTPIVQVGCDDAKIEAAIKKARERLPEFVAAFERRGAASEAIVKARFAAGDEAEHMWAKVLAVNGGSFEAQILNRPAHPGLPKEGQRVVIKPDEVSDWAYLDENGKGQGMFVERVLRK